MKNRASAEALPKFSFSSAASTKPTKNRANAEALPKFPSTASARSDVHSHPSPIYLRRRRNRGHRNAN